MLVRDSCHALPPQEVCARLRDRRWELDRRYNSALQSERTAISNEQRGIDARLSRTATAERSTCRGMYAVRMKNLIWLALGLFAGNAVADDG